MSKRNDSPFLISDDGQSVTIRKTGYYNIINSILLPIEPIRENNNKTHCDKCNKSFDVLRFLCPECGSESVGWDFND